MCTSGADFVSVVIACSLRSMMHGLQRAYNSDLLDGEDFIDFKNNRAFEGTANTVVHAMNKNADINPIRPTNKAEPTSYASEEKILASPECSKDHPHSLLSRVFYYVFHRFALRGKTEAYELKRSQFKFGIDSRGRKYIE
jgi:hypothetical protein